jgi:EmrB/QacA subfamily drug resistance transporter
VPDEITSIGHLERLPPLPELPEPLRGRAFAMIEAACLGDAGTGAHLIRQLRRLGPELDTFATIPPPALRGSRAGPDLAIHMSPLPRLAGAESHQLCGARSPCRTTAWRHTDKPTPYEEILVPDGTLQAGLAAQQSRAAAGTAAQRPRRLGLALAVIATAQLMIVLDLTIVTVALPHIQTALGFSGSNLEWVVNAYAVAFGGLLLLGGRSGDLLERRRVFIAGLLVFSLASLLGGLATDQAWLITARAAQGVGAAMAAPTALSLIAVTFPEGPPRTRATAVYSAMAILGSPVGLIAGGLLVTYVSWRWVMFVNVPIGLVVAVLAARVLPRTGRRAGRFDLPGAITATAGVAALVYGLSNAATTPDGVSHWGDAKVIASLAAAAVLLVAFALIETRTTDPLLPVRVLRSRDRSGAYLITLCIGIALFSMFFFLTLFIQDVWGYSALKTGLAYLPWVPAILVMTVFTQQAVPRIGARLLLAAGSAISAGAMFWLSRITEHSTFAGGMLGPELLLGAGLGPLFVLIFLVGLTKVNNNDTGAASSLINVGQQVGGAVGLAVLGTVAWSAVASSVRSQAAAAARAGVHATGASAAALQTRIYHHALATGFSRGYLISAGIMVLAVIIALAMIRIRRQDLSGASAEPMAPASATNSPSRV